MLSCVAAYELAATLCAPDEMALSDPVHEFHVEVLQAVALLTPGAFAVVPGPGTPMPTPGDAALTAVRRHLIGAVYDATLARSAAAAASGPGTHARQRLLARLKLETQTVRRVAPRADVRALIERQWEPLGPQVSTRTGLSIPALLTMWSGVEALVARRLNAYVRAVLRGTSGTGSRTDAVRTLDPLGPACRAAAAALLARAGPAGPVDDAFANALLDAAEAGLADVVRLTLDEFRAHYPGRVREDDLRRAVDAGALAPGDPALDIPRPSADDVLTREEDLSLLIANPVRARPLVRLGPDAYALFVVGAVTSALDTLCQAAVRVRADDLVRALHNARGPFLEAETAAVLARGLRVDSPDVLRELVYGSTTSRDAGECDAYAQPDVVGVIAEAKAHALGAAAVGDFFEVNKKFKRMHAKAAQQADGFARQLLAPGKSPRRFDRKGKNAGGYMIDVGGIHRLTRLATTLERLPAMGDRWGGWMEAGFDGAGATPLPVYHILELEVIARALTRPGEFLHYLRRREAVERRRTRIGDELDVLAEYIFAGGDGVHDAHGPMYPLPFPMQAPGSLAPADGAPRGPANVWGWSHQLTDWLDRGGVLPQRHLDPLWARVLDGLDQERPYGWTRGADVLYGTPLDHAARVASDVRAAVTARHGRPRAVRPLAAHVVPWRPAWVVAEPFGATYDPACVVLLPATSWVRHPTRGGKRFAVWADRVAADATRRLPHADVLVAAVRPTVPATDLNAEGGVEVVRTAVRLRRLAAGSDARS